MFGRKVAFSTDRVERVKRESEKKVSSAKEKVNKKSKFRTSVDRAYSKSASGVKGVSSTFDERTARFNSKPSKKSSKKKGVVTSKAKSFAKKQFKGGLNF